MIPRLLFCAVLSAAAPAAAATHTVVPGDHLWGLAGHYYSNHFRWKVIYAANRDKIKDPHWIYPGQVLDIPEVPSAEIGELPARPVEKEPAAVAPPPEAQAPQQAAAEPEPARAPEPPRRRTDDLSTQLPEGLAGQYPSVTRAVEPKGWKEDGKITEFDGREGLAAQGDYVFAKVSGARQGERYTVYRKAAPQELDADQKASYLEVIGSVEAQKDMGDARWRLLVLKSGDSVQVGDLLKKDGGR